MLDCKTLCPHDGIKIVVLWGVTLCDFVNIFLLNESHWHIFVGGGRGKYHLNVFST
jgi:hypothetical protein